MKIDKLIEWIWNNEEISKELLFRFLKDEKLIKEVCDFLVSKDIWIKVGEDNYTLKETAKMFKNKKIEELKIELPNLLKDTESFGSDSDQVITWENLKLNFDKFIIYKSDVMLYELIFSVGGKKGTIRLEGKEIMDVKSFILRFFEEFGTMLPMYKGVSSDWAKFLTMLYQNHAEINYDKSEIISPIVEAKELVIDSIENSVVSDDYSLKEGIICFKNDTVFISTKVIKKLLKRSDLHVSLRNLAYSLRDLLISSSVPIKVENKSERFWRFNPRKLNIDLTNKLDTEENEDE